MSRIFWSWGKGVGGISTARETPSGGKRSWMAFGRLFFRSWVTGGRTTRVVVSLTLLGVMVLAMGIWGGMVLDRQREKLYNHAVNRGMLGLDYLGHHAKIPLIKETPRALHTLIRHVQGGGGYLYISIVDECGVVKAHTNPGEIGRTQVDSPPVGTQLSPGGVTCFIYGEGDMGPVLTMSAPVFFKGTRIGSVYVGLSMVFIDGFLREEGSFLLLSVGLLFLFGMLLCFMGRFGWLPFSLASRAWDDAGGGDEGNHRETALGGMDPGSLKMSVMRETLGLYMGTEVLDLIMRNPESAWLKGRKSEATILFADIRGFTAYAESCTPEVLVEELNHYFDIVTATIIKHGGVVDKFIGDAVLAVFGVPVYDEYHAPRCVRAAMEIQQALGAARTRGGSPLLGRVGISIKSGDVVAGSIGSPAKMEYTVIGDTVNIAAHMNALAGAGEIVVDRHIMDAHGGRLDGEPLVSQKMKGRMGRVEVYRVTGLRTERCPGCFPPVAS